MSLPGRCAAIPHVWRIMLGHDCNLQDEKGPWLVPGNQAGLPRDERSGRNTGRLPAGRGMWPLPAQRPKGKDWSQPTRATGSSTPGLGKALENSSGASGKQEHNSGTGMAPTWPLLEVLGRPFGLHQFKKETPALCLHSYLGSIFSSTTLEFCAHSKLCSLWCHTAGEGILRQSVITVFLFTPKLYIQIQHPALQFHLIFFIRSFFQQP